MPSSKLSDKRREMLVVDGFRFVNFATFRVAGSKYSVASLAASSQNFLSAASLLNLGIGLVLDFGVLESLDCFGIDKPFFAVLISGRNNADEGIVVTQGKNNCQQTACMRDAQCQKSGFRLAVFGVMV